jgi:hypothetical protein
MTLKITKTGVKVNDLDVKVELSCLPFLDKSFNEVLVEGVDLTPQEIKEIERVRKC